MAIRYRDGSGRFCTRAKAARLYNLKRPVSSEITKKRSLETARSFKGYRKPADLLRKPAIKPPSPVSRPGPDTGLAPPREPYKSDFEPAVPTDFYRPPPYEPPEAAIAPYEPPADIEHDYSIEPLAGYDPMEGEESFLDDGDEFLEIVEIDGEKGGT
jgi:hypothetical protein